MEAVAGSTVIVHSGPNESFTCTVGGTAFLSIPATDPFTVITPSEAAEGAWLAVSGLCSAERAGVPDGAGGVSRAALGFAGVFGLAGVLADAWLAAVDLDAAAGGAGLGDDAPKEVVSFSAFFAHGTAVDFITVTFTPVLVFPGVDDDVVVWDDCVVLPVGDWPAETTPALSNPALQTSVQNSPLRIFIARVFLGAPNTSPFFKGSTQRKG